MTLDMLEKLAQEGMFDAYREEIGVEGLEVKALVRKLVVVARAAKALKAQAPGYWSETCEENEDGCSIRSPLKEALAALEEVSG